MKKIKLSMLVASLLLGSSAFAYEKGDWVARGGLTTVSPDASSSNIQVGGADFGLPIGPGGANVLLGGVDVDSNTTLGLNLAYFVTDNINIELLAATPFKHDIEILGGVKLGDTKHLPPSLTANYYFADSSSKFQPYIGAGINYTIFFDEGFDQAAVDLVAANTGGAQISDLELDASFGLTAQVGFDYMLTDEWMINASVRYINIETDAEFSVAGSDIGRVADVDINPWVYSVLVGYRF